MAFLNDDEKLLGDDPSQQQQQMQTQTTASQSPLVGGGGADVGAGAKTTSTAGVGSGGSGGWTNIQAYLNANKDNSSSANSLQGKVQGQFDQERKTLTDESSKMKSDAQGAANKVKDVQSQAGNYLTQAANNYSWDGNHDAGYQQYGDQVRGALNNAYSGPTSYNYGFGNETQKYGNVLQGGQAFDQFMGDLHQERAGGQLSSGQRSLQTQFDVNNDNLNNMRENLLSQFAGLGSHRDQVVTDTTNALSQAEQDHRTSQNALRDYLSNTSNSLDTQIGSMESSAKHRFDTATREKNLPGGSLFIPPEEFGNQMLIQEWVKPQGFDWNPSIKQAVDANNFYYQEREKNRDLADMEKRQFNTLQDWLNSENQRKEQGYEIWSKTPPASGGKRTPSGSVGYRPAGMTIK